MNGVDLLLAVLILAALAWAIRRCIRNARSGKNCCGDCAACTGRRADCKEPHT